MTTLSLSAISGAGVETSVTFAADHFLTVVFASKDSHTWLNDS